MNYYFCNELFGSLGNYILKLYIFIRTLDDFWTSYVTSVQREPNNILNLCLNFFMKEVRLNLEQLKKV